MIWVLSMAVALLTGLVAAFAGGWVASHAVDWYGVSSFEGQSGYAVVGFALLSLVGGLAIGLVVARLVLAQPGAGFLPALAFAQAATLLVIGLVGGTARLLADVSPRIDGEALLLAVELRLPQGEPLPGEAGDEWFVRLGSVSGQSVRGSVHGPLWREDARQEDGRWIVPGAVDLFTSRGQRMLDFEPDGIAEHGFLVPLPGYPGREFLEWSEWLPRARPGADPLPEGSRYRFRLVPAGQSIRVQTVGPFEVRAHARGFSRVTFGNEPRTIEMAGELRVSYRGEPLTFPSTAPRTDAEEGPRRGRIVNVSVVAGPQPALLMYDGEECALALDEPDGLRLEHLGACDESGQVPLVKASEPAPARAGRRVVPRGRLDDDRFARRGVYMFDGVLLDTRTLQVRRFDSAAFGRRLVRQVAPLGLSPDERSLARLIYAESAYEGLTYDAYEVAVLDLVTGTVDVVPYTGPSLRAADYARLDEAWLEHFFRWERGADAIERLAARPGVGRMTPRGRLTVDTGGYREYHVWPVAASMRPALIEWLVAEFGAEPLALDPAAFSNEVRIDGQTVHLSSGGDGDRLGVWMARGVDSRLVESIAERFDQALASRDFDHHFLP